MKKQANTPSLHLSNRLESRTFANGLRVHIYPNHRAPTFSVQAWIATGSIHEEEYLGCGLSHFLEHMLFNGTEKYPDGDIIKGSAQKLGLSLNAYTSFARTTYLVSGGSAHAGEGIDLIADMISAATFPADAFRKEKEIILREYAMGEDNSDQKLVRNSLRDLFRISPLNVPVIGTQDGISSVTGDMMSDYYHRRYSPHRCDFVITGDVEPEKIFDQLAQKLTPWKRTTDREPVVPVEPARMWPSVSRDYISDPQWKCAFSYLTGGDASLDALHANVLGALLGGYDSALLTEELQNRKNLTFHTKAFAYAVPGNGLLQIQLHAAPGNSEAVLTETRRVLDRLCTHGVSEEQRLRMIRNMETSTLKILQSNEELASAIGSVMQTHRSVLPLEQYTQRIQEFTCEDIRRAAEKIIGSAPETLTTLLPSAMKNTSKAVKPLQPFNSQKLTLSGGKQLLLTSDAESPFAGIIMYLRGGKAYENKTTAGFGSLLSECLFCGAGKYDEEAFKQILDDYAIDLDITVNTSGVCLTMECLKTDFDRALKLLIAMMSSPLLPKKAVEREKKRLIADIREDNAQPLNAAMDLAKSLFFDPASALARQPEETVASVGKATPEKLRAYWEGTVLTLKNAAFGAYGSLTAEEARKTYEKILREIPWNKNDLPVPEALPHQTIQGKAEVRAKSQTIAIYAMPCPKENDRDAFFPIQIITSVNDGLGSFIFNEVREKRGLAYYAGLMPIRMPGDGMTIFYAGIRDDAVAETFAVYESIRKRFAEKGITKKQFEDAKLQLQGIYTKQMEDAGDWTKTCVKNEYRGCGADYPAVVARKLKTETLESVNSAIRKIFSSPDRKWIIVSPKEFSGSPFEPKKK